MPVEGDLDLTFDTRPKGALNSNIQGVAYQSDGKIVIVGSSLFSYNGVTRPGIARINPDGSLDTSFNPGTGASGVFAVAIQSDGKILISGTFTTYNGIIRNKLARINPDGSLDPTFNPLGGANFTPFAIAIQADGKILVGGNFTTFNSITARGIIRLNANGTIDTTFNTSNGISGGLAAVYSIAIQPSDNKILIGGDFTSYFSTANSRRNIARINTDGTNDSGFTPGSGAGSTVRTVALQTDGKIVIGGDFNTYNSITRNGVARILTTGAIDPTFTTPSGGVGGSGPSVRSLRIQSDNNIMIAGIFTTYSGIARQSIARLATDGTLDTTFAPGTGVTGDTLLVHTLAIQSPSGKIFIGGAFEYYNGVYRKNVASINTDGSIDTAFNPGLPGPSTTVHAIAIQPTDGKILIGGDFTTVSGTSSNRIARVNPTDATLDTTFVVGTGANDSVRCIAVQSDGKVLIGGGFTTYNGVSRNRIARLNADGTLDGTFDTSGSGGADAFVLAIAVQADNKILIGGSFSTYAGVSRNRIARLNANGTLDISFTVGTGFNGSVRALTIQSSGKVLAGGDFATYNGTSAQYIARLTTTGGLDGTFTANPNGSIYAIAQRSTGDVLIGGQFTNYDGASQNRLVRLTVDGAHDTTFNSGGTGANNQVSAVIAHPTGKVLIGGIFTSYNGTTRNYFARTNADGTLDSAFNPGTGPINFVRALAVQTDGQIILGGDFTSYASQPYRYLARVYAEAQTAVPPDAPAFAVPPLIAGDTNIMVRWTVPNDNGSPISQYDVRYKATGDPSYTSWGSTTDLSANVTGLTDGIYYLFSVRAVNGAGPGPYSVDVSGDTVTRPSPPQNFAPTPGDGQMGLTWMAPADDGGVPIIGYKILYGPSGGGMGPYVGNPLSPSATSATITGLTNGTSYDFSIVAYNGVDPRDGAAAMVSSIPYGAPIIVSFNVAVVGVSVELTWTVNWNGSVGTLTLTSSNPDIVIPPIGPLSTGVTFETIPDRTPTTFTLAAQNPAGTVSDTSDPIIVYMNSFPLRVNPYLALNTIQVYGLRHVEAMRTAGEYPTVAWSPALAGSLLRDLNHKKYVYTADQKLMYIFSLVQLISGPTTEGVSGSSFDKWKTGWICTWADSGAPPIFT
jgi:uncharacterized delta-60 repeat protein